MDPVEFRYFFQQANAPTARGKFLSRVFGIFSESIVQIWCEDGRAPFKNLGRPTLRASLPGRSLTLDFLFECRSTGRRFVVEQKCEIEFNGYRYFTLTNREQLRHHTKPAFAAFLAAADNSAPGARDWKVGSQQVTVDGAILIWGAVAQEGRAGVMAATGLHDVIGLDQIIADCAEWKPEAYCRLVNDRRKWSEELFAFLDG